MQGVGLIPGQWTKISCASGPKNQIMKQKQYCDAFNKDFKNGPHKKNLLEKAVILKVAISIAKLDDFQSF